MWHKLFFLSIALSLIGVLAESNLTHSQVDEDNRLPLLGDDTYIGLVYAETVPSAKQTLDNAFGEMLRAGLNGIALPYFWEDLEPTPGEYDTTLLEQHLELTQMFDMQVYIVIRTIDTITVHAPSDLAARQGATGFKNGLHFDSPEVLERFQSMLAVILPVIEDKGVFFISVGNEIDTWLNTHPNEIDPFVSFVAENRAFIQAENPDMGVGATIMFDAVRQDNPLVADILAVSAAAVFTYYPLNGDFTVRDPSVVTDDFALMMSAAGTKPLLLQEVGYPAGYTDNPTNNSSGEKQAQFIENVFAELPNYPKIQFLSFLQMADWLDEECDYFLGYYSLDAPRFREYLCSLGIRQSTGEAKPAYDVFLQEVRELN